MTAVKKQLNGSWWFERLAARRRWPSIRSTTSAHWVLQPGDRWHGFAGSGREPRAGRSDQGHDPHAGSVGGRQHAASTAFPAAVVTKFLSSRRIEIEKTGLYSFLVLFSMGITKGKWSTLVTELLNFKDLYDANAPLQRVLPALVEAHPEAYATMGLKELCDADAPRLPRGQLCRRRSRTCTRRCPRWRCAPPTPTNAWCAGEVESVEIDNLTGRTLGGDGGALPARHPADHAGRAHHAGHQIDPGLSALRARVRPQIPRFRDRHPRFAVRADRAADRRYLVDCVNEASQR